MKLIAELNNEEHALEITRDASGRITAEVDGRRYVIDAREPEANVFNFLTENQSVHEFRVAATDERGAFDVSDGDAVHRVRLIDPKRLRAAASGGAGAGGRGIIAAQMPGKVVRVMVEAGAQVEANQPLVVVEAMKMQNELKAPRAGTIVEVKAAAGATVNAGEVLLIIE